MTQTAKQMVMRFGMSEKLGPRVFGHDHGQPVPRPRVLLEPDYSNDIARGDRRRGPPHRRGRPPAGEGHARQHRSALEAISEILLRRETIEGEEFEALLAGKTEEEVFGPEVPPTPRGSLDRPELPRAAGRETPRPLPRPGFEG